MAEPAVLAEKIERRFDSVLAVAGVDLSVPEGQIYGFLGPNGAGKSTTVLMLTTLLPPSSGTARVAGYDVVAQGPEVRSSIGAALRSARRGPSTCRSLHRRTQSGKLSPWRASFPSSAATPS